MTNHKLTQKQMAALGIGKTESGDFDYLDPKEKSKSKYEQVDKQKKEP
jgi:hypothetical protein